MQRVMTPEDLRCLAEYRKHKGCLCPECQRARAVLADIDDQVAHGVHGGRQPAMVAEVAR